MTDPIFEHYKEALKAGHVAVLRGRLEDALAHYREAASIADERPLPHASLGGVLLRLGRTDEALAAYARALGRAPRDEGALAGRAEALIAAGRRAEAAEVLERLADVQAASDRMPEAVETLRRALEFAETKRRRRRFQELVHAVREEPGTQEHEPPAPVETGAPEPGETAELAPAAPPPDPEARLLEAATAAEDGRVADAVAGFLEAAAQYAAADAPDAALDACERALGLAPGDAALHLMLARLYLARGWRDRASEKLVLLDRFLDLGDPDAQRPAVAALGREALPAGDWPGPPGPT